MSYTESKLQAENRKLKAALNFKVSIQIFPLAHFLLVFRLRLDEEGL